MNISKEISERLGSERAESLVVTADQAALLIRNGMTVAISGFTSSGYPKAVPEALAQRAENGEKIGISLYSGASVGPEVDTRLTETGVIKRRFPYQTNSNLRNKINQGDIDYQDIHLSQMAQYVSMGFLPRPDVTIVEAMRITEDGDLILTTSIGNTPTFVDLAESVIVEVNMAAPIEMEGMHDIYTLDNPPFRKAIPIEHAGDRIGGTGLKCGWDKIKAIVITDTPDKTRPLTEVNEESRLIGSHIVEFLKKEVESGRLTKSLLPLQSGVGSVANAVLYELCDSDFEGLTCYTEVMQDSMLDLLRSGKATVGSTTAVSPSPDGLKKFIEDIDFFRDKIVMRPQEISNNPEVIRRLGVIAMNTALEADIYGNVNSTHVNGSKIMNGIGGSGDFSRNGGIVIFSTPSLAKGGKISSIVPMCSHVDHTEHEVMVLVTEQGYADLRGLSPKERALAIIQNCAHPDYREDLLDYFHRACDRMPCQTPHILEEALSWHTRFAETGTMKK